MTRTEVVVSELLTALPVVPPQVGGPLLRALGLVDRDPDYTATVDAGYLELDVDAWYATVRPIPADWAERLAAAACFAHVVLATRVTQLETLVTTAKAVH